MKKSTVSGDEIIRGALSCRARQILQDHNHSGGRLQASSVDIAFTRKAAAACRLAGYSPDCPRHRHAQPHAQHVFVGTAQRLMESLLMEW